MGDFIQGAAGVQSMSGNDNVGIPYTTPGTAQYAGVPAEQQQLEQLFSKYFPQYNQSLLSQAGPGAAAAFGLYNQYAPQINTLGQNMAASNQLSQSNTLAQLLNSPNAASTVSGAVNLQNQINPQFSQINSGWSNLLSTLAPPGQLSGSMQSQIERGNNQQNYNAGNGMNGSPLTTINNAINYGTGLQNQQQQQSSIFGNAASSLGNLQPTGAFGLATGQPNNAQTQFGSSNAGSIQNSPSQSQGVGSNFMSGLGNFQNSLLGLNAGLYSNNANSPRNLFNNQVSTANNTLNDLTSMAKGIGA